MTPDWLTQVVPETTSVQLGVHLKLFVIFLELHHKMGCRLVTDCLMFCAIMALTGSESDIIKTWVGCGGNESAIMRQRQKYSKLFEGIN